MKQGSTFKSGCRSGPLFSRPNLPLLMAHRESQAYQTPPLPGNTGDDENASSTNAGKGNPSEDHVHWDFDAPRFWDLNNPDAGTGFDDTWFGRSKRISFVCKIGRHEPYLTRFDYFPARRPVTPTTVSPSHRPFSERKPRRSGVKGSPLRMMKTPPHHHQNSEESMTFFDLPATPLMSKTLNHSTSHYATPTAGKSTQADHADLDIPLSPFLNTDLVTSSTPVTKPAAIPTLPARATAFSTSRQHFIDRQQKHHNHQVEEENVESVSRGTKRSNEYDDAEGTDGVWDDQHQEFRPVIDNIKRRISTIVFKCTNRDISTPLRRRSLLRDLKSRSDKVVDKEDKDATEALAMLKEAIKGAREQESMVLDGPLDEDDEQYDTPPTDNIPSSTIQSQREIVRGTDSSAYMKESPIVTDGERRYITVYLPRQPNIPEHRTSMLRSPHTSFVSSRPETAETDNPFEVNGAEREYWEKRLQHKTGSTSARLASLNDRLRRAESAQSPKKIKSLERPRVSTLGALLHWL